MKLDSDLEIDVNGEEIFFVNKEILCSYSGMLRKLFRKSLAASPTKPSKVKVIFHDLPGGAEAFEQMTKFCYNNGKIRITPNNTCLLYYVAEYMEISTEGVHPSLSLINQVLKSVQGITNWSWHEVLTALKQCKNHFPSLNSSGIHEKLLHSVVARIAASSVTIPCCSSPESSGLRFSLDAKSCMSSKNSSRQRAWWFQDVVALSTEMVGNIIKRMISQKVEHATISRFLFYCLKCKISSLDSDENSKVIATVVDLLYSLDANSVSCKGLFDILRICCSQVAISSSCRERLEYMIGRQIDNATLDDLLISSPVRDDSLYDVNLLLRLLQHFLASGGGTASGRLKKVGGLVDLYMTEVAPDSFLKPSKFLALATALPEGARDSHDSLYLAINMYIEVHDKLGEEEKMQICCAISKKKLSLERCKQLAQNSKRDSCSAVEDGRLRARLEEMQWRMQELEKACSKMQKQMAKMTKTKSSSPTACRSLPRLCS